MTTEAPPDITNPETWEDVHDLDFRVCPVCQVAVPDCAQQAHIEAKHTIRVREAVTHVIPNGIVAKFLQTTYARQIAALHSQQYWEQDVVERALGAIYQFQNTGRLAVLQSTFDAIQRAAVEWWGDEPK